MSVFLSAKRARFVFCEPLEEAFFVIYMFWVAFELDNLIGVQEVIKTDTARRRDAFGFGFKNTVLKLAFIYPLL